MKEREREYVCVYEGFKINRLQIGGNNIYKENKEIIVRKFI